MQQQQIALPLIDVAGITFNFLAIIAIDRTGYIPGAEGRAISLYLTDAIEFKFEDSGADEFQRWYLQTTGQAAIQPAAQMPFGR